MRPENRAETSCCSCPCSFIRCDHDCVSLCQCCLKVVVGRSNLHEHSTVCRFASTSNFKPYRLPPYAIIGGRPPPRRSFVCYTFSLASPESEDCLTKLGYESGVEIHIDCIDIQRKPRIDLSKKAERDKIAQAIKSGVYGAILLSPPGSTFSRRPGPSASAELR